jgi:tight adherence protein B
MLLVGVGSVGLGLVTGPVVALVLVVALAAVPRLVAPAVRRRRLRRRDEQLAPWLERIASGLRAGLSLTGALTATLPATPVPLRDEVAGLEATVQAGGGLAAGLARWAASPDATPPVVLVASALDLGIRAGGEVARAVDRVAATLRDRMEAQAEARALATQAIAPLGFCALLATVEPAVPQILLTTPLGWACLVGGLGLEAAGAAWMARIVAGAR